MKTAGTVLREECALAETYARFYRSLGFNPLPSHRRMQLPATRDEEGKLRWKKYQWEMLEDSYISDWKWSSIQMVCGAAWSLAVVDADEKEGVAAFRSMCERKAPLGAYVVRSPGGGRHYWFSVPESLDRVPTACLWSGSGSAKVEFLGDGRLIKAPPSPHWKTGRRYEFMSPDPTKHCARPSVLPDWLLELAIEKSSAPKPAEPELRQLAKPVNVLPGVSYDRDEVLAAVHDKPALAAAWGLRITSRVPNASGWLRCHSVYREDRNPSASFSPLTGVYWEQGMKSLSFFDLAVELGAYRDLREAIHDLAATHGVRPKGEPAQ